MVFSAGNLPHDSILAQRLELGGSEAGFIAFWTNPELAEGVLTPGADSAIFEHRDCVHCSCGNILYLGHTDRPNIHCSLALPLLLKEVWILGSSDPYRDPTVLPLLKGMDFLIQRFGYDLTIVRGLAASIVTVSVFLFGVRLAAKLPKLVRATGVKLSIVREEALVIFSTTNLVDFTPLIVHDDWL